MHERRTGARQRPGPLLWLLVVVAACTSGAIPVDRAPLPTAFADGVPGPTDEPVLTLTTQDRAAVAWDLATLALLDQRDLTIIEPFLKEEHTYAGPLWADVLRASGVDLDAGHEIELVALDDYVATIPTDATTLEGVVLAHRQDGEPIAIAEGGPIRLVYPPDNPAADIDNYWIWSIVTARVL